jgi:hypothetical protein
LWRGGAPLGLVRPLTSESRQPNLIGLRQQSTHILGRHLDRRKCYSVAGLTRKDDVWNRPLHFGFLIGLLFFSGLIAASAGEVSAVGPNLEINPADIPIVIPDPLLALKPVDENACSLAHSVQEFGSLREMPKPIVDDLLPRLRVTPAYLRGGQVEPPIAERNEAFNLTDAMDIRLSFRRFMRAGRFGDLWFIWYEHGGIVYNRNIVLYEFSAGSPRLLAKLLVFDKLCAQTDQLLDGKIPPPRDFDRDLNW